jgi:hypothetical protein
VAVRNPETPQSVGFIWDFPLVFASSAFVPALETLAWLAALSLAFVSLSVRAFRRA